MIVYVNAVASDASLQLVRDQLDGLSTIVDADGIRYLLRPEEVAVVAVSGAVRFETAVGIATAASRLNPVIARRRNRRSHVRDFTGA